MNSRSRQIAKETLREEIQGSTKARIQTKTPRKPCILSLCERLQSRTSNTKESRRSGEEELTAQPGRVRGRQNAGIKHTFELREQPPAALFFNSLP